MSIRAADSTDVMACASTWRSFDGNCIALCYGVSWQQRVCVAVQYVMLRCSAELFTQCLINYVRASVALPIAGNRALAALAGS